MLTFIPNIVNSQANCRSGLLDLIENFKIVAKYRARVCLLQIEY